MKLFLVIAFGCALSFAAYAQSNAPTPAAVIRPGDNLVTENIPPVPASIAAKADQYVDFRSASLLDWAPVRGRSWLQPALAMYRRSTG